MRTGGIVGLVAALVLGGGAAHAQIVNGGFETGDFTGWSLSTAAVGSGLSVSGAHPHTGSSAANFFANNSSFDVIKESMTTSQGTVYSLDFYLFTDVSNPASNFVNHAPIPAEFIAMVDATTVLDLQPGTDSPFTHYAFQFNGTGGVQSFTFKGLNKFGSFALDDVSIKVISAPTAAPEPGSLALFAGLAFTGGAFARRRARK